MLRPEKGMKVMHRVHPQNVIAIGAKYTTEIYDELDKIIKEWTDREESEGYVRESRGIIDNVCFANKVERIHGTTHIGADLYADSVFEAIVTYHIETWSKVREEVDESDPAIVDIKYFEGGWM